MGTKKLQGPCVACETVADMRYRSVTELGLSKAYKLYSNKILNLKLGDILCNNCYMKIVEGDRYEKQKPKVRKQSEYDSTYQPPNKKRVTMSQKNYENLFEKAMLAEELQEHINQLEVALEQALKNPQFINFFNDKIKRLTSVLYTLQHQEKQKPFTNPEEFISIIEARDPELQGFFDILYQSTNPSAKNKATQNQLRMKIMFICYQIAALRNKQVSGIKTSIGLFMSGCGTSVNGINSLAGMGLSSTYQTVFNRTKEILINHNSSVEAYINQNNQRLLVLNIDDYHNLHQSRIPSTTSISQISHMATLLINNIAAPPHSIHNPIGIEAELLKNLLKISFKNIVCKSYNQSKMEWNFVTDMTALNGDDLLEFLVVHSYDTDLLETHSRRSFKSTKLVDFLPQDLKNTDDYLKSLKVFFSFAEVQNYLKNSLIPVPADFPGQLYIRRAIIQKLKFGDSSSIPNMIMHLVTFLGALHVSLNTRESCFLVFWSFFNELYKAVFKKKNNLAAKPKPWRINLLLYLAHAAWKLIKKYVITRFNNSKDLAYCTFFDLLDTLIPSTLDVYATLFRNNHFNEYIETIFRLWTVMCRFQRKNYNKIMIAFLSDIQYWTQTNHPILSILKTHLNAFDEYPVENLHSLVRRHTSAKVLTPEWLRCDGIFIDHQRHDNFAQIFKIKKSYPYSKQNLDVMTKSAAIFLLQFFDNLSKNLGQYEVKKEGKQVKKSYWYFPGIPKGFSEGALPLGYHSAKPSQPNHFCDAIKCTNPYSANGKVIPCGHAYHDECWIKLNYLCIYCHDYLSDSIDELTRSYNKRLEMANDIQDEFEISKDELTQEDTNQLEDVPVYEQLDQKFRAILTDFIENKPLESINKNNYYQEFTSFGENSNMTHTAIPAKQDNYAFAFQPLEININENWNIFDLLNNDENILAVFKETSQ